MVSVNRSLLCTTGLALLLVVTARGTAHAHKIKVFATAEGAAIRGYVYLPGGGRAQGVAVVLQDGSGAKLAEATTNRKGEFQFEAKTRSDHRIVVDTLDGHRATFLVEAVDLADDLPAANGPVALPAEADPGGKTGPPPAGDAARTASIAELKQQVRQLAAQIERAEEKRRFQDILGGIGYVLGLAGIAFYFLGTRRKAEQDGNGSGG